MKQQHILLNTRNTLTASVLLVLGVLLTLIAGIYTHRDVELKEKKEFQLICSDIQTKIYDRLHAHAQLLRSGAALFSTIDTVDRNTWRRFYNGLYVQNNIPGIQGFGFSFIIQAKDLQSHIERIRHEGFVDYNIRPADARDVYTSIIFLEPFAGRNLRAFGYDMFSEPTRRRAMEFARDSNRAMLSGRVVLVQETSKDVQAGTLMYVPVYRRHWPIQTVAQRRAAIIGWVYSPYRMNDLMSGILGRWDQIQQERIRLQIYDNGSISSEQLLFDSQQTDSSFSNKREFQTVSNSIEFNGNKWLLCFTQSKNQNGIMQSKVLIVVVCGIIISLLLFILSLSLLNTRLRAQKIAELLTREDKDARERFQMLLNSAAEAIYGIDLGGNCTFSNNTCLRILGYSSQDDLLGKNMHSLIHHSHNDGSHFNVHECAIYKALEIEKGIHVDNEVFWRADGTSFPTEYWSYPIFINGKVEGAVVTFFDITERKQFENEMMRVSTRLSLATRAGGVGVWEYDLINNQLLWDDQMFALYGITKDYFSGAYEAWLNGLHPEDVARGNEEIELAILGEKEFNTEFRVCWPNGTIHTIRALATVLRDETGKALQMVGTNWDITEQKKTEEALRKAKQEADSANTAKSEFLANMSHEIRTPMNAILGFSEALYRKLESKQHQQMIKSVLSSGNLLLSLLNDILDLSKIEAGKLEILRHPVDINTIAQDLLVLFSEKAQSKGLDLQYKIQENFPKSLLLDEIRIKQILFNLVGNAIKFTHTGYVAIDLQFTYTTNLQGNLRITVSDTGIGIPESQFKLIFEAFQQQYGQSNREYGGTGLGLAISQRLVTKMNGHISLQSTVGAGTNFIIEFPETAISSENAINNEILDQTESLSFEPAILMVIDDVVTNIETIENLLSPSEIVIINANDGIAALDLLKQTKPDLILLDMRMSGIDGYEVAQRVKDNPATKHIPIVAYTASVLSSKKIEQSGNFAGCLYKPIKRKELLTMLRKFLKYTIEYNVDNSKEICTKNNLIISDELHQKLPQIVFTLNDTFRPRWENIKDSFVLYEIEAFADDLHEFANKCSFDFLTNYTIALKEEIDNVDLEALQQTLRSFELLIQQIERAI